jgi:probable F420-dependent oxidoreductase
VSVRVGLGWSPFETLDPGRGRFWRVVDLLEELGVDSLWLSDTATLPDPAPLVTLAAVAARTERLKLGTGVLVMPPRRPLVLAKELATLDVISGGRLFPAFGLGIDMPAEREAMGVPAGERVARLEEGIAVLRALWAGGPVTHRGALYALSEVTLSPTPTRPRLDIWLGGRTAAALERVGRLGDGWLASFAAPPELAAGARAIREAAAAAGRAIEEDHYGATLFAVAGEDDLPPGAMALLGRRRDLRLEDHVAFGAPALRDLLRRFVAAGASKFVVVPIARDVEAWIRAVKREAVDPVEAAAV